jgi:D-alanyl-D-alanine carboxypeptidase/D-alanyl-D-alanine-endopeptidase (penicillin-binding protein 4)
MDKFSELATVQSPPLRQLVREILKTSQNLDSDLLLAHLGERSRISETSWQATSEQLGIHELGDFLVKAGIPQNQVLFDEGSGLSRNNLTTPDATVGLLQFMALQACSNIFFEALPIAGVDGTLQNRMKSTGAKGHVRAKTGTLNRDSSLSGLVQTAAGEHVAFSIMLNRYDGETGHSGADIDPIAVMLAEFKGRSL